MIKRTTLIGILSCAVLFGIEGRVSSSQSLGGVVLLRVKPRILTPNNDARNDVVFFDFDNTITGLPIESGIYDVHGAKVASLRLDANDTSLTWDGRDSGGNALPAGVYIYMIEIGKNRATGTVVVAR